MRTCLLCGFEGEQVTMALARWIEPGESGPFGTIWRCVDHAACRRRVESSGQAWEVDDSTAHGKIRASSGAGAKSRDATGPAVSEVAAADRAAPVSLAPTGVPAKTSDQGERRDDREAD